MLVFDFCVRFFIDELKIEENVVRIFYLVNFIMMVREDERLDIVCWNCYSLIKDMEFEDIMEKEDFKSFDCDILESVLVKRME